MPVEVITAEDLEPLYRELEENRKAIKELSRSRLTINLYLSYKEVTERIIQIDFKTLHRWAEQRLIERTKVSNRTYYGRDSIIDFLSGKPKYKNKLKN